ncbi:MAG: copper transporter [Corynebacterium sp.]|nr:copper transporter [Corynebacterium sp.]
MGRVSPTATTLAGLFFGSALGLAGGTYVLAPASGSGGVTGLQSQVETLQAERDELADEVTAADRIVGNVAETALSGTLGEASVAVFAAPTLDSEAVVGLTGLLDTAGAKTVTRIDLTDSFLTQNQAETLKNLAVATLPAGAQLSVENREPGMHVGQLVGAALGAQASQTDRDTVFAALTGGGFIGDVQALPAATTGIVLADPGLDAFTLAQYRQFAAGLTAAGMRTVLAAPGKLEATEGVTAVSYLDRTIGRVQVVEEVGAARE